MAVLLAQEGRLGLLPEGFRGREVRDRGGEVAEEEGGRGVDRVALFVGEVLALLSCAQGRRRRRDGRRAALVVGRGSGSRGEVGVADGLQVAEEGVYMRVLKSVLEEHPAFMDQRGVRLFCTPP